jgi:trans-aconitate methyltransferase
MDLTGYQWANFYQNVSGRQPRPLLIDVLKRYEQESSANSRRAIDLGCGDGTETAFLLANGWHVVAIDGEPAAFEHLHAKIPAEAKERLQTQVARFEEVALSPAELIYAGYSLPFCHPQHFDALWSSIVTSITPGGRFAGQLFGVNDTWASNASMTFFTLEQARNLFTAFEVEHFLAEDEDGQSTIGPKHWHVFDVIACKK